MLKKTSQGSIFLLAFLAFLVSQLYLTADPFFKREVPVEADDAYGYILKAEEMQKCFLQDCPALVTLKQQLDYQSGDEQIGYNQVREYHRLFVVYHPLHSVLINLLRLLGFTFEGAYAFLAITTKVILCGGLAYWMRGLFGELAAAIALVLLTPVIFIGTGLHTMVPSTMALSAAVWLWGLIANQHPKQVAWFIPLVLVMILFHQVGKIYAGTALCLYILSNRQIILRDFKQRIFVLSLGLVVLVSLVVPSLINQPVLDFDPKDFYPYNWNLLAEIVPASVRSLEIAQIWFGAFTFPEIGLLLISYAFYSAWQAKATEALKTLGVFLLQLGAGIVYVVPWFGALLFERIWIPFAVLLTGFMAMGLLTAVRLFANTLKEWKNNGVKLSKLVLQPKTVFAMGCMLSFSLACFTYPKFYAHHYQLTLTNQIERQDLVLNPEQPKALFSELGQENELILYMQELPLYYYMTMGGLNRGAIYLPIVRDSGQEDYWLQQRAADIHYLVALNGFAPQGGIQVNQNLRINSSRETNLDTSWFEIYVQNPGTEIPVTITWASQGKSITQNAVIPVGHIGWLRFSNSESGAEIQLATTQPLFIEGIRLDSESTTRWPWETGVHLEIDSDENAAIEIDYARLLQGLQLEINVIDDTGAIVLAQVE